MLHFDATREGNRAPIRKLYDQADANLGTKQGDRGHGGVDSHQREFFIQGKARGGTKVRGVGSAGDVEMMFMKTRKPVTHIKKKSQNHLHRKHFLGYLRQRGEGDVEIVDQYHPREEVQHL